ncbi:hypothetical protein V2I01_32195 [Micromonospora sp. BRA006-A]|nr:hypothetical protein [Micromonospora sp. BRA006-A]
MLAGEAPPASVPTTGPVTVGWNAGDTDGPGHRERPVQRTAATDGGCWPPGSPDVVHGGRRAARGHRRRGHRPAAVRVTDGVNTADATSGPLTVARRQEPGGTDHRPMDGTFFATGQTVTLAASVTDPEQG